MKEILRSARLAGWLYLIMFITGPLSILLVDSNIIVSGNAAATAQNLVDHEALFRAGILGQLIVLLLDMALAVLLYIVLKPVNRTLALMAAAARLVMTSMRGINLVFRFIALMLAGGTGYLEAMETSQLHTLAMLFLEAFNMGFSLDLVFFSVHLILVGILVWRSGYIPGVIGVLLLIAGLSYLTDSLTGTVLPELDAIFVPVLMIPAVIGELAFMLWLVIRGISKSKWEQYITAN